MNTPTYTPTYDRWSHGGWYTNTTTPSGASGCVSRNYPDKQWRIVCDVRSGDHTYPSRDAAARAEHHLYTDPSYVALSNARYGR